MKYFRCIACEDDIYVSILKNERFIALHGTYTEYENDPTKWVWVGYLNELLIDDFLEIANIQYINNDGYDLFMGGYLKENGLSIDITGYDDSIHYGYCNIRGRISYSDYTTLADIFL
jgi:hypothetical protein